VNLQNARCNNKDKKIIYLSLLFNFYVFIYKGDYGPAGLKHVACL